ncbi:hypothetical protein VW35_16025 [Devosia soli]|uniref:Phosphatidic acid phosphatase type 2/haloperoxidase domain-containing protein n=1 Tax=Devosia soli TaxID=361041 RepID=A0A0F5L3J8_9HYPH|nr:phosphatase PAP2 family protein [Devosia soli]KKB76991.1 hypothetical protein VW35_16025 [Devosia soli]
MTPSQTRRYFGIGLVAALIGAFGLVAEDVVEGETKTFDDAVLMSLRVPGHPEQPIGPNWLPEAVRDITSLGSYSVLTIFVLLVAGHLLLVRRRGTALLVVLSVVSGSIISTVLKTVFDRPRPALTGVAEVFTASFPSGHSLTSAVTFLTIGAVLASTTESMRQRIFYVGSAIVLTLMVGLTRIYLGVHYPTDVFAGWCLGSAWALGCFIIGNALARSRHLGDTTASLTSGRIV